MNPPERRSVSLTGLSLIGAGAVLGLALAVPAAAPDSARPAPQADSAQVVDKDHPDR